VEHRPTNMGRLKLIAVGALLTSSILVGSAVTSFAAPVSRVRAQLATAPTVSTQHGTICLFWPNETTAGWPQYQIPKAIAAFKHYMPNMKQLQYNGNSDAATQLGQVQACIAQKATAAVISPAVPEQAGAALKALAAAHIPAVALDQDPDGGPVYSYVWVDFKDDGSYFGRYMDAHLVANVGHKPVLVAEALGDPTFAVYQDWLAGIDPYLNAMVKDGTVKIVCKFNTTSWEPTVAQTNMEQCLTKTGNDVDAVLAMNDSVSDGVAAALSAQNLLGKVKIYGGRDGDLETVQRILAGDQFATFYSNAAAQGDDAVVFVEAALAGKPATSTGLVDSYFQNGYTKGGVPTVRSPEILVTASNVQQTIIKDGLATKAQICTSIAKDTAFCKS
jgi:D-xylose transport system substrate-binding protein